MNTNQELAELLIKDGYLKTPAVIDAFKTIDRKDFVLEAFKDKAYINEPLLIGGGQTISQPLVVAFMLELLDLKPGERVLEIGTGSGWKTALMAQILKPASYAVISVERLEEMQKLAKENLAKYGFEKQGVVRLVLGDGSLGCPEFAPYDKIISAASADEIPPAWLDQLKIGGKIVAPVKNSIIIMEKKAKADFSKKEYFGFNFVPLVKDQS